MSTPYPFTNFRPARGPLVAPGSFRRTVLYQFKGMKPKPALRKRPRVVTEQQAWQISRKSSPVNIRFCYLYRDASNYKQRGEAVFANRTFLTLAEIEGRLRACLKDGAFFIAGQVHIEERFFDALREDDHPWHELERVEITSDAPFDPLHWQEKQHRRDISEFLADFEKAHRAGWDEMNVRGDLKSLLEAQKINLRRNLGQP
jgi:hypothetical protein